MLLESLKRSSLMAELKIKSDNVGLYVDSLNPQCIHMYRN